MPAIQNRHIWVLGSANIDTSLSVTHLPAKGSTVLSSDCRCAFGGKGANQAAAAALAGSQVSLIGCVGDDSLGKSMLDTLKELGIDTAYITQTKKASSGCAFITTDQAGANTIVVYPGANLYIPANLTPDFRGGDLLIAQFEIDLQIIRRYFKMARDAGLITLLNPSPFRFDAEILGLTDILVVNEHEAGELTGITVDSDEAALEAARAVLKAGVSTAVISLGKVGALAASGSKAWRVREYPVLVKDTQGAGDAFLGMFAASLSTNMPIPQALLKANIASSLSVGEMGSTQVSFPAVQQVEAAYRRLLASNAIQEFII